MAGDWLVDEGRALVTESDLVATIGRTERPIKGVAPSTPAEIAVKLMSMVCGDVHKLFGGAGIRLDVIIVTAPAATEAPTTTFYAPTTFRFPDIHDGQRVQIDPEAGLLLYDGQPTHFLDIHMICSRDKKDSEDLSALLASALNSKEVVGAMTTIAALAVAAPAAAAVAAAVGAAAVIGQVAYGVVEALGTSTVGMYHGSFLQYADEFGLGVHPSDGDTFKQNDLEFAFSVVDASARS